MQYLLLMACFMKNYHDDELYLHKTFYRTTTMIFEPGQTLLTTSVAVLEDELPENTETFFVSLSNPQGGAEIGPDNEVTVNILANDNAYGIIEFAEVMFLPMICVTVKM